MARIISFVLHQYSSFRRRHVFLYVWILMGYQYLKQKPKPWKAHVRTVPYMYIHRLLRLTPSLVVFFFFIITVFRLMGTGPMWNEYTNIVIDSCKEYWWSYMLYIQNYYNWDDMCMVPTWYIAADMQMFILSPLIAIPVAVALSNSSRFKATMKRLFVLNVFFTLLPLTIKLAVPEYKNTYDTHSRLINYFLGFMLATFMRTRQDRPFLYMVKSKHIDRTNLILWIIVLCGMLATVIGFQYIILEDDATNTNIYHSFMRPAWCIGLSWIVYSSHHGYGGFVSWLLCRPTFQVLGKLTYSMYLLHSMVLVYFICTVRTQYYFSDYNAFYMFCGHYVVTVIVSFFWTLAFESPVLIIEKLMFGGGKKKREDKTGIENDNNVNIVNNVNSDNNVNIDNNVNKELEPNGRVESENKRYVAC
ncbi:hypothetical protein NQ318_013433 [Aromia moschata]|uniref:Acyltransferase 3 domain-containing protein n=1 Tax=Aromia moschata TaxID=1265417 RepID=A0AAV8YR19_9CUCU|nr:hypothetical protein NQ318_013433 [Aromia moschata]